MLQLSLNFKLGIKKLYGLHEPIYLPVLTDHGISIGEINKTYIFF